MEWYISYNTMVSSSVLSAFLIEIATSLKKNVCDGLQRVDNPQNMFSHEVWPLPYQLLQIWYHSIWWLHTVCNREGGKDITSW